MKKLFIFAAIAAAGLFASCSSTDDAVSQAPDVIDDGESTPAISIGIGTPAGLTTRGTGTIGGVGTETNQWHGQEINVFMFTKDATTKATTLNLTDVGTGDKQDPNYVPQYLYNNLAMYTPGTADNKIDGMSTPATSGEAMIKDGTINYYPAQGNFDFFGYHGDDAVASNAEITKGENVWTVPFVINGTQDLMSTKAELLDGQDAVVGNDFYSAKAARKQVQPTLTFKHLLTRLSFSVIAGNDAAAGFSGATTPADVTATDYENLDAVGKGQCVPKEYEPKTGDDGKLSNENYAALSATQKTKWTDTDDNHTWSGDNPITAAVWTALTAAEKATFKVKTYTRNTPATTGTAVAENAVKIKSIKIKSKNAGTLAVAWTAAGAITDANKITWNTGDPVEMTLMERPAYKRKSTAADPARSEYMADGTYDVLDDEGKAAVDAEWGNVVKPTISAAVYAALADKSNYEAVTDAASEKLTTLTPTSPSIVVAETGEDRYPATALGEALILAPSTTAYEMDIVVSQKVKTNWVSGETETKEMPMTLTIPVPQNTGISGASAGFLQNTSYNVKLTIYGFERIVVNTKIEPWVKGEDISVGQD